MLNSFDDASFYGEALREVFGADQVPARCDPIPTFGYVQRMVSWVVVRKLVLTKLFVHHVNQFRTLGSLFISCAACRY